ncbi:MAG TPA: hypothetical protein VMF89_22780 [Polyangiales bacterium]|nr:hypothetical protein [Polyangiales bacterium]
MTRMYACSVVLECEHRSADGVTDVHTYSVQVPTFYLLADVQGILHEDHARAIAERMFERTENLVRVHACAVETSMAAHTTDNVERELGQPIHCARCGAVSSSVRRDHDNVARCDVCYRGEFEARS